MVELIIMALTSSEVEKLARMAKIELSAEEKQRYTTEISSILQYVDKLQEIRVKEDLKQADVLENRFREDKVIGITTARQQQLINQAPESVDNLIKTKAVF